MEIEKSEEESFSVDYNEIDQMNKSFPKDRITDQNSVVEGRKYELAKVVSLDDDKFMDLEHDLKLGWIPQFDGIQGPLPYVFSSYTQNRVLKEAIKIGLKCIYQGKRYANSFEMHEQNLDSGSKYEVNCGIYSIFKNDKLKNVLLQHHNDTKIRKTTRKRTIKNKNSKKKFRKYPLLVVKRDRKSQRGIIRHLSHTGFTKGEIKNNLNQSSELNQNSIESTKPLNPNVSRLLDYHSQSQLQFDSNFESGNLDMVFQRSPREYDLLLRPDTNSRGHSQWFYFNIKSKISAKYRLRIVNMVKPKAMYLRGGRPFIGTLNNSSSNSINWKQMEKSCRLEYIRSDKEYFTNIMKPKIFMELSFDVTLEKNKLYYICYSIPYSYSRLNNFIESLNSSHLTRTSLCQSESKVSVPLLSVTNSSTKDNSKKPIIYVIGRVHPSESAGSFVMEGFIKSLLQPNNEYYELLRELFEFKIIPMINPDGVLAGNFRTNTSGDDLNRRYDKPHTLFHPTICAFRKMMDNDKKQNRKIYALFDLHGHSCRKNVFIYGPKVSSYSKKSQRAKSYAYILSTKTELFKFEYCIWKLRKSKRKTLRGLFLAENNTKYVFTVESSVFGYNTRLNKNQSFSISKYQEMGRDLIYQLSKFSASTLINYGAYFADYSLTEVKKTPKSEKSREHKEMVNKIRTILKKNNVEQIQEIFNQIKLHEKTMKPEEYSEGGSDSELSDDDFKFAEKRQLLKRAKEYSKQYENGLQSKQNFAKNIHKKIRILSKRQFKGKVNEFKIKMETDTKFKRFENKLVKDIKNQNASSVNNLFKCPPIQSTHEAHNTDRRQSKISSLVHNNTQRFSRTPKISRKGSLIKERLSKSKDIKSQRKHLEIDTHLRQDYGPITPNNIFGQLDYSRIERNYGKFNRLEDKSLLPISIKNFDLDNILNSHVQRIRRERDYIEYRKGLRKKFEDIFTN